jgi:hypothetical protein
MALLSAYATDTEYRARTGDATTSTNATLNEHLLSVSRMFELSIRVMPGAFNTHTGTYTFDATGGTVLNLRDRAGRQYFLASITADSLGIDTELDATYDGYELDLSDAWVRGLPENAAAFSEPFRRLELLTSMSGANPGVWPIQKAAVQITGTWGWAAVPEMVVDAVCHRTQELREALKEGGTGSLPAFAAGDVQMRPTTAWLWKEAERMYGGYAPRSFAV